MKKHKEYVKLSFQEKLRKAVDKNNAEIVLNNGIHSTKLQSRSAFLNKQNTDISFLKKENNAELLSKHNRKTAEDQRQDLFVTVSFIYKNELINKTFNSSDEPDSLFKGNPNRFKTMDIEELAAMMRTEFQMNGFSEKEAFLAHMFVNHPEYNKKYK